MKSLYVAAIASLVVLGAPAAFAQPMPGASTQQRVNDEKDQERTTGIPKNSPAPSGSPTAPSRRDLTQENQVRQKDQEMTTGIPANEQAPAGYPPAPSRRDLTQENQGRKKDQEMTTGILQR